MKGMIEIDGRLIGEGHPVYCIAELSANHNQDFEEAKRLIRSAKESGADAVKIQTYTPDTITIDCRSEHFLIGKDSIWHDRYLYDLYKDAYTPWEWQPKLKRYADEIGITLFSSPFDDTAVDFLEKMDVPAYKIASFEMVDIPLIKKVASTMKPIIMSTGMATLEEIDEAVAAIRSTGNEQLCLLKCLSAYPAPPEEMNLNGIGLLSRRYGCPIGVSDHTLGDLIPVASVALGAAVLEKHFTHSRSIPGPDSAFSSLPSEFKEMVDRVRLVQKALGTAFIGPSSAEKISRGHRRSLYVIKDLAAGEEFNKENVRSIRPGNGLHPRYMDVVLGKTAKIPLKRGTPLTLDAIREPI